MNKIMTKLVMFSIVLAIIFSPIIVWISDALYDYYKEKKDGKEEK